MKFLNKHHVATRTALKEVNTVTVYKNGQLTLWEKSNGDFNLKATKKIITSDYNLLKSISHIPVLIRLLTIPRNAQQKLEINDLYTEIKKIRGHLSISTPDYSVQHTILASSEKFLSIALNSNIKCEEAWQENLHQYTHGLDDALDHNCRRATEIQLTELHATMERWRGMHLINTMDRTLVVGTHGPRECLIEMQYFREWYLQMRGIKNAENRILYYVETLPNMLAKIDIKQDLIERFLAAAELNKSLGKVVKNGNDQTMSKDVLGYYAPAIMSTLFAKANTHAVNKGSSSETIGRRR